MAQTEHSTRGPGLLMAGLAFATLAGLMILVAQDVIDQRQNPNRNLESVHTAEAVAVTLQQSPGGHYLASGTINGEPVTFLLDTGATHVAIPANVADDLALTQGRPIQINTANGVSTAYSTTIDELGLGDIRLRDVRASITPGYQSEAILLGMSALDQLEWQRRGSELTLRHFKPAP